MAEKKRTVRLTTREAQMLDDMIVWQLSYIANELARLEGDVDDEGEIHWAKYNLGRTLDASIRDINPLLPDPRNELIAIRSRRDQAQAEVDRLEADAKQYKMERQFLIELRGKLNV